jgi:hypothetical protein
MKDKNDDKACSFLSLIKKIEKIDRDMREVKEALLTLRERIIDDSKFPELLRITTGEDKDG